MAENNGAPGADGISLARFRDSLKIELERLAAEILANAYEPFALLQVDIPNPTGGLRTLAYPTVRDRVAQTEAMLRLQPLFEAEFEECSFAYRRGRSVRDAIHRIHDLRDRGYRWVVDADVHAYFDCLPHARLLRRLARLVTEEEDRLRIGLWATAPRWDGRGLIVPARGIPQGAIVSPNLANLFLDDLDEVMEASGHKLVRYADDFLVLCRTEKEATEALDLTDDILDRLGLVLNEEKTTVTTFDRGFKFLGAIFVRSLIAAPFEDRPQSRPTRAKRPPQVLGAQKWQNWLQENRAGWRRYVESGLAGGSR